MTRHREAGLTLIEMAVVLAVIGLLSVIAVPRMDISRYRINTAMQAIATQLMSAQRYAVTRQHDVMVTFDQASNGLIILDDANNSGAADAGERSRRVPLGDQISFDLGGAPTGIVGPNTINFVKRVSGKPAVVFHRNGSASETGGFYMVSMRAINSGGHPDDARMIEIERATGRVSWYKYDGSTWKRGF